MKESTRIVIQAINARAWSHWSLGDLCEATGYTRTTVWESVKELQALKLVRYEVSTRGWRRWTIGSAWRRRTLAQVMEDVEWAERAGALSPSEKIDYKRRRR